MGGAGDQRPVDRGRIVGDPDMPDQVPPPESPYQPPYQPPLPPPASPYQAPVPQPVYPYSAGPQNPPTVLSLLSMIFGIVGVAVSCCYGAGFLFSVAGVVLGHLGLKRESARGMALTGLITGYVGLAMVLIWVVVAIGFLVIATSARY